MGKLAINNEGFTSFRDMDNRWALLKESAIFWSDSEQEEEITDNEQLTPSLIAGVTNEVSGEGEFSGQNENTLLITR